jgi:ABC-type Fe3+-hydroxamate transport system substrate-binding protein
MFALAILCSGPVPGCGAGPGGDEVTTRPSPDARALARPSVVSLSPAATRFVLAIGAQELLVGVDEHSKALPGTEPLPTLNLATTRQLAPDLVLVSALTPQATSPPSGVADIEYVEFAPHDLEEVFDLTRSLGERLVGRAQATRFERSIARPLARVGGSSPRKERPRIAAVVDLHPVRLAGGHSFATDLIEIAGGNSVTHGGEESTIVLEDMDWQRLAPDLVLVLTRENFEFAEREALKAALPPEYPVIFFLFDAELFWLDSPAETASRLQEVLASWTKNRS